MYFFRRSEVIVSLSLTGAIIKIIHIKLKELQLLSYASKFNYKNVKN